MKRLDQLKARLKVKQAEAVIRIRHYSASERALAKVCNELAELKRRIKIEEAK